eukprot:350095-Chlamydomonas_euryale.AAC.2
MRCSLEPKNDALSRDPRPTGRSVWGSAGSPKLVHAGTPPSLPLPPHKRPLTVGPQVHAGTPPSLPLPPHKRPLTVGPQVHAPVVRRLDLLEQLLVGQLARVGRVQAGRVDERERDAVNRALDNTHPSRRVRRRRRAARAPP